MRNTILEGLSNKKNLNVIEIGKNKIKIDLSIFSLTCNSYHGHYQTTSFTSLSCMDFIHFLFTLDEVYLLSTFNLFIIYL